ncbi:thiamine diphosphokinase [Hazenella coriacea]|uniref:Thiamine diphosphokinase n=1 Tax=Hazenella coriacea TaxID=1179467 RepID=A0A4R3L2G5_9BACL|nr:thiamine diphosphokinase [Hazenella coriacea]TCS93085.1 thiamine diphosphokinase [Hazenella coriacea]
MKNVERVFIVAGGELSDSDFRSYRKNRDTLIAADGGAQACISLGYRPDLVVGDFDTTGATYMETLQSQQIPFRLLPVEKAHTDTHMAIEEALRFHPREIYILGALGGARFDHMIANIGLLEWIATRKVDAFLLHQTNRIRLLIGPTTVQIPKETYHYLSILPVSKEVEGVQTDGFLYPLHQETLYRGETRGVSNEWARETASITFTNGICLVIESNDQTN